MSKTIIVSNRLPVRILEESNALSFTPSEGGLATGLGSIYQHGNNIWIGWPGKTIEHSKEQLVSNELNKLRLEPVFLSDEEIKGYYEGFSNELLWPIFHYTSTYAQFDPESWETYKRVNEKFCEVVLRHLEPGDTLWVHDYQLLLLPGMVREKLPDVTIAFFQHIPFPSQEIFRLIPWRKELLKGMIGADLIGFHTFDDVRHFISAATHLLSLKVDANHLIAGNRAVAVEPFPMGIDFKKFSELSKAPKVQENIKELKTLYKDQKIILSIDRLDYSKGILQRLQAFELFLQEHPEQHEKIVFYMIVVPSRDTVPEYQKLKHEIDRTVGNINANYRSLNWLPIIYFYQSFAIENLSALYNLADVCLITSLRDGMNLVSKEYVASRNDNKGVLILSEMAGASKELIDAIIVNPTNIYELKEAVETALIMPEEEVVERMSSMRFMVAKFNISHWVKIFMERLKEVKRTQESMKTKSINSSVLRQIKNAYSSAKERLILLDYDGTLVEFKKQIEQAVPDEELYSLLDTLQSDPKNTLIIISGRNHKTLENWFGKKPYRLIAEHGAWSKTNDQWVQIPGLSSSWKEKVNALMEAFSDRTPGSFIEEKSHSLVWHYRKVQKGLGDLRGNELLDNLRYLTAPDGLQLLNGNKVIEVKNTEVNKGKATLKSLDSGNFDFILAMGDDYTDEDTFKALPEDSFTIKVGSDSSAARYFVDNPTQVRKFLFSLIEK